MLICACVIVGLLWVIAWQNYQHVRQMLRFLDQLNELRRGH